jgi:hypothetical protein
MKIKISLLVFFYAKKHISIVNSNIYEANVRYKKIRKVLIFLPLAAIP